MIIYKTFVNSSRKKEDSSQKSKRGSIHKDKKRTLSIAVGLVCMALVVFNNININNNNIINSSILVKAYAKGEQHDDNDNDNTDNNSKGSADDSNDQKKSVDHSEADTTVNNHQSRDSGDGDNNAASNDNNDIDNKKGGDGDGGGSSSSSTSIEHTSDSGPNKVHGGQGDPIILSYAVLPPRRDNININPTVSGESNSRPDTDISNDPCLFSANVGACRSHDSGLKGIDISHHFDLPSGDDSSHDPDNVADTLPEARAQSVRNYMDTHQYTPSDPDNVADTPYEEQQQKLADYLASHQYTPSDPDNVADTSVQQRQQALRNYLQSHPSTTNTDPVTGENVDITTRCLACDDSNTDHDHTNHERVTAVRTEREVHHLSDGSIAIEHVEHRSDPTRDTRSDRPSGGSEYTGASNADGHSGREYTSQTTSTTTGSSGTGGSRRGDSNDPISSSNSSRHTGQPDSSRLLGGDRRSPGWVNVLGWNVWDIPALPVDYTNAWPRYVLPGFHNPAFHGSFENRVWSVGLRPGVERYSRIQGTIGTFFGLIQTMQSAYGVYDLEHNHHGYRDPSTGQRALDITLERYTDLIVNGLATFSDLTHDPVSGSFAAGYDVGTHIVKNIPGVRQIADSIVESIAGPLPYRQISQERGVTQTDASVDNQSGSGDHNSCKGQCAGDPIDASFTGGRGRR
jgi:hypothetical protein